MGDVFEGARALPADRRPAYLAERCGGDEALRQEVESLLAWDARAESLFETPVLVRVDDAIVMRNLEGSTHRPVSAGVEDRRGRHGRGLQSARHAARSHRRDQGPARAASPTTRSPRALRARGARRRRAESSAHLHAARRRPTGQAAADFLVMEYLEGETLAERLDEGAAAARPGAPLRRSRSPTRSTRRTGTASRIAI